MAEGDVLQIVIFSVIFALAVTAIGKKAKAVVDWCQSLADIMFRFTEYVMKFAPVGDGAAMAYTIAHNEQGLGVLKNLGALVLTLWCVDRIFAGGAAADSADISGAAPRFYKRGKNAGVDRICDDVQRIGSAQGDGKSGSSRRAAAYRRIRSADRIQF